MRSRSPATLAIIRSEAELRSLQATSRSIPAPRHFLEALDQPLAFEAGQPLDPEQAVQLIDLMLVADCAQTRRFLGLLVAVDVLIADPDARVTADFVVDTGHRDAAFLMKDRLGRCPDDLRIDVGLRTFDGVEGEHHDPKRDADMWGGDSNTRRGVHRLEQIVGQIAQRVVKHGYGLCRERKARVGITDNWMDGHDLLS
jgi:hypothetical protein